MIGDYIYLWGVYRSPVTCGEGIHYLLNDEMVDIVH